MIHTRASISTICLGLGMLTAVAVVPPSSGALTLIPIECIATWTWEFNEPYYGYATITTGPPLANTCAALVVPCNGVELCTLVDVLAPGSYVGRFDGDPCIQGYLYFGDGGIITANAGFAGTANAYGFLWHWEGVFLENPCLPGARNSILQFGADLIAA